MNAACRITDASKNMVLKLIAAVCRTCDLNPDLRFRGLTPQAGSTQLLSSSST